MLHVHSVYITFLMTNTDDNNISLTFRTSVNPLSLMPFPSRWLSKFLTTILFSTSPSKRMNSNVLLEMRRDENCSGATMALTLSITSQLEMLFPGSLSWGSATLMVILAIGLRYTLYSEERQIASEVSLTMVVMVAVRKKSCRSVGENNTVKTSKYYVMNENLTAWVCYRCYYTFTSFNIE